MIRRHNPRGVRSAGQVSLRGGRTVHWVTQDGAGPLVLLLGGCGIPSMHWDDLVDLLPDLWVVRLDRPGLAGTPWPARLPRLAEEIATLSELIEADLERLRRGGRSTAEMNARGAVVVAHGRSALYAVALAAARPDLVAGLVLVEAKVRSRPTRPIGEVQGLWLAQVAHRLLEVRPLQLVGSVVNRVLMAARSGRRLTDRIDPALTRGYRSPDTVASVIAERTAYRRQVLDLHRLRQKVESVQAPAVLLGAGGGGPNHWLAEQRRLAESIGGRHQVVEDSRHLMMLDRPEAIAQAIREIRDLVGDSPGRKLEGDEQR